eukprot:COSAG02_NODE_893_length_16140_cov_19.677621_8_plen_106_part_00
MVALVSGQCREIGGGCGVVCGWCGEDRVRRERGGHSLADSRCLFAVRCADPQQYAAEEDRRRAAQRGSPGGCRSQAADRGGGAEAEGAEAAAQAAPPERPAVERR